MWMEAIEVFLGAERPTSAKQQSRLFGLGLAGPVFPHLVLAGSGLFGLILAGSDLFRLALAAPHLSDLSVAVLCLSLDSFSCHSILVLSKGGICRLRCSSPEYRESIIAVSVREVRTKSAQPGLITALLDIIPGVLEAVRAFRYGLNQKVLARVSDTARVSGWRQLIVGGRLPWGDALRRAKLGDERYAYSSVDDGCVSVEEVNGGLDGKWIKQRTYNAARTQTAQHQILRLMKRARQSRYPTKSPPSTTAHIFRWCCHSPRGLTWRP
ncbi:hypothetical protein BDZ89DRAFT_1112468 [Hymenopellis radicata]|nr:hypothetical protein BDZ89DRAFT_1112468 [Hymenopellis radicata]